MIDVIECVSGNPTVLFSNKINEMTFPQIYIKDTFHIPFSYHES